MELKFFPRKISVKVKTNAKKEKIEKVGDVFLVSVKEPPKENKANKRLIELLSDYFKVPQSRIFINKGIKSKQKIVEIKHL